MIKKTIQVIKELNPIQWFIENPRGLLRKMWFLLEFTKYYFHTEISYCKYGHTSMKPTDIWYKVNNWTPRPMCNYGNPDHSSASRKSKTGIQGMKNAYERSILPKELCLEFLKSAEDIYSKTFTKR
jgi:hypothetical protein